MMTVKTNFLINFNGEIRMVRGIIPPGSAKALSLAHTQNVRLIWLKARKLKELVPLKDDWKNPGVDSWDRIERRMRVLRESIDSIVVNHGRWGALALIGGRWYRASAYDVRPLRDSSRCDEVACNTFIAATQCEKDIATCLKLSVAAAGMHLAGAPRKDWGSIERFSATTQKRHSVPPQPLFVRRVLTVTKRHLRPVVPRLAYLAMGILIELLVQSWSNGVA